MLTTSKSRAVEFVNKRIRIRTCSGKSLIKKTLIEHFTVTSNETEEDNLNTKARYIRKSSLGRSRLICQSPLKCTGQIQNGGRFEFKKGKL